MSKKLSLVIIVLLAVTSIVAAVHLANQESIACMEICLKDQKISVSFEDLEQTAFSGELTDGKGNTSVHNYTGILLRALLEKKGVDVSCISGVSISSADNYSVDFGREEVLDEKRLYVAVSIDGKRIEGIDTGTDGVQIIIFGDPNSRRCVRYARTITVLNNNP